ncbi:MAG: hypothetical protein NT077_00480 [Candidatus Taylorbacteria bacterium]|nr:hypothetical protein [Candidatus Taylorbacteria bacterium]
MKNLIVYTWRSFWQNFFSPIPNQGNRPVSVPVQTKTAPNPGVAVPKDPASAREYKPAIIPELVDEPRPLSTPEKEISPALDILEGGLEIHPRYAESFWTELGMRNTLNELVELYNLVREESEYARHVLAKIEALTGDSFDAVEALYKGSVHTNSLTSLLLRKALGLATEPSHCIALMRDAKDFDSDKDPQVVIAAVKALDWPKDRLEKLRDEAEDSDYDEIVDVAMIKLVGFCTNVIEILDYYLDCVDNWENADEKVFAAIYQKLFELATCQELQTISRLADQFNKGRQLRMAVDKFLRPSTSS